MVKWAMASFEVCLARVLGLGCLLKEGEMCGLRWGFEAYPYRGLCSRNQGGVYGPGVHGAFHGVRGPRQGFGTYPCLGLCL